MIIWWIISIFAGSSQDFIEIHLICKYVSTNISLIAEKWRCCQKWQREGIKESAHEQPVMNYMAEGLISFLSAHGTLGDELRFKGSRELTWCRLFGWCILGWSAVCHRKMSSKGYPLNMHLTALVLYGRLCTLIFKEALQPQKMSTKQARFSILT